MNTNPASILIIDDEPQIRKLFRISLRAHGYELHEAENGRSGIDAAALVKPDLILLDMGLPDMSGIDVIRSIREWTDTPIIIVSVQEAETDKIGALDCGANDYVVKPFGMGELMARIRTALRHSVKPEEEPELTFGDIHIDLTHRRVLREGEEVRLTPTEYDVFKLLVINHGKVLTQKYLLETVWGKEYDGESQYLRVYIGQLRKKLESEPAHPVHILTEPGIGFRLV